MTAGNYGTEPAEYSACIEDGAWKRTQLIYPKPAELSERDIVVIIGNTIIKHLANAEKQFSQCNFGSSPPWWAFADDLLPGSAPPLVREAEWRPIETAPKDGTLVDIWLVPDPERQQWFKHHLLNAMRATDAYFNGSEGSGWFGTTAGYRGRFRNHIATHWMPLPASPSAPESKDEGESCLQTERNDGGSPT